MSSPALIAGYRAAQERRARLHAMAFPAQRRFINDGAKLKAALCTRRAGKSFGIGVEIAEEHDRYPGASSLYVGLTRTTAKRVMWKDILKRLDAELKIGWKFNHSDLSVTHPNGAVTYFLGVDASDKEQEKALGQKYRRVWVDEAQSYTIDLRNLVYSKLAPAVADYDGTISLHGTPGDFLGPRLAGDGKTSGRQLFFAITKEDDQFPDEPREPGWSTHRWSALDNPHMRAAFERALASIERDRPHFKETPQYMRDYLGRWAIDVDRLVYRYSRAINGHESMVDLPRDLASFCIVTDLGFNDSTAYVVVGWRPHDPTLYILFADKRIGQTISHVADDIRALRAQFPGAKLVIDGAAKQSVEELRQREKLPLLATDKTGKVDFIRFMNSALAHGQIRVVVPACRPLIDEWSALVWDERSITPKTKEGCEDHCADAGLYGFRYARNFIWSPEDPPPPTGDAMMLELWREEERRLSGGRFGQ